MNLVNLPGQKYIKIDFKNKLRTKNKLEIETEISELKKLIEHFQKQIPLEEIHSFIYKKIEKDNKDSFKQNKDYTKRYKREFPFTPQDLSESVKRILASNFSPNFIFNKTNLEDFSRTLWYAYKNMKAYGIKNQEKLLQKIKDINIKEKDIINMYLDFDLLKSEKYEKILKNRNKFKNEFYANKNPNSFNSTGNLNTIHELYQDENSESNIDGLTEKGAKTNDNINSIVSDSDDDQHSEGVKKIFTKIKSIFDTNKKDKKDHNENNTNNKLNDIDNLNNNKGKPFSLIKEYFIYPEKNNINIKYELPIELLITLKKLENVKVLIFQIKGMTKKMVKENIFLLSNLNFLFPNYSEIIIDLNDDKISQKINKIYGIRNEELLKQYKLSDRIIKYNKNYQSKTINCWTPEGTIIFENEQENNENSIKKNYVLEENIFENSELYGNKLSYINSKDYPKIKYIISPGQYTNTLSKKYISNEELDESEEISSKQSVYSEFSKIPESKIQIVKRNSIVNTMNSLNSLNSLKIKETIKTTSIDASSVETRKTKTTPQLLLSFARKKQEPFEMILLYGWFLDKIINIKALSLYFNDGFSLETEFYLRNEKIVFEGFHFLLFSKKLKELKELNVSFNSIDNGSFKKIIGLINSNKNISILRINFFPPNANFEVRSLLKLISLMKLSVHHLYKEEKMIYIKEKEIKDLEMDYFLLNHKFNADFEKNIYLLFDTIKNNINHYKEIIFRIDLPSLILSIDKYINLIIKFIINIIALITFSKNEINIFKIISPELILDGRTTPFLRYLFKKLNNNNDKITRNLTEIIFKCKIYRIPDLFNFCLYKNINNIRIISISDIDFESFSGFMELYNKNIDKMVNLQILKIGLNNSIISYDDKVSNKINAYINKNTKNLEEKILYSFIDMNNDFDKMNNLVKIVQRAKINKLVIQIGKKNIKLLNRVYQKQKRELELLYLIFTQRNYKVLLKEQIIKYIKKFFCKHKEKIVICRTFFSSNEFY